MKKQLLTAAILCCFVIAGSTAAPKSAKKKPKIPVSRVQTHMDGYLGDRIDGSAQVLRHLNHPWIRTMITTHDFELCALEEQAGLSLVNVHFEEHYQNQKIFFDYKLKPGRCTQRNARYLMKMIGITD